ncbi:unnamed protein product, partial [Didymodactylos carnosus]
PQQRHTDPKEHTYPPKSNGFYLTKEIHSWSEDDVMNFMNDNKLYPMTKLCRNMNGTKLYELYRDSDQNSVVAHNLLKEDLKGVYGIDLLPRYTYLSFIGELREHLRRRNRTIQTDIVDKI